MLNQLVSSCSICEFVALIGFDNLNERDERFYLAHVSENHGFEA